jgi:hypothetical protein
MKGPLSILFAAAAAAGVANAGVAPPPPSAPAGLALNAVCADNQLIVTIDVTPHDANVINAGQYFLDFNTTILDFNSATAGEEPFDFIIMPPVVNEAAGTIEGFATGSLIEPGSNDPKTMAVLIFDVDPNEVSECDVLNNLLLFQTPPAGEPRTELTLDGGLKFVPEPLENLGPVTYDTLPPDVGPITVTPGDPCELVVAFEADILEACCLGPIKIDVLFPDNPDEPCATALNISYSQVPIQGGVRVVGFVLFSNLTDCPCNIEIQIIAMDCCGQMGSNSKIFAVEDVTPPEVTVTSPSLDQFDDFETPADAGGCTADVELTATAWDNCDGTIDPADIFFVIDLECDGPDPDDPVCGNISDCCYANGTPGCDDATCQGIVCGADAFCCDVAWDGIRAAAAQSVCAVCSGGGINPCTYTFPQGTTCVWAITYDHCGNVGSKSFTVTVTEYNEMVLDISLQSVFEPSITRCIDFELYGCGGSNGGTSVDLNLTFTSPGAPTDARFYGTVLIPCGLWNCATAEDPLHTLRRAIDGANFQIVGTQYVATFPDSLLGGNYDEFINYPSPFIDVGDFSVWASEFQAQATYNSSCPGNPDGCTPCGELGPPHADGSGDGYVTNTADFTFIQINWLLRHEDCCDDAAPAQGPATPGWALNKKSALSKKLKLPILQMNVAVLAAQGHAELAPADLNGDGWIDIVDMLMVAMHQMAGTGLP